MKENTNLVENNVKEKKKLSKLAKALIAIFSVVAVVLVLVFVYQANKTAIMSELTYMIMPKSVDVSEYALDGGIDTLYVEKNEDFDPKADAAEPLNAFCYYYYDANGEKVFLKYDDVILEDDETEMIVYAPFYLKMIPKIASIKNTAKIIGVVLAVIAVVALIIVWFVVWSKNYDKEKEKAHANQNGKKKNKKRK
ncbi:MAG: hypothetical protein PUE08_04295 [Eubacteriales bacterium]|nr:hypothetical protein [Eubacteriales bacterium]